MPTSTVYLDGATGFRALHHGPTLTQKGITLDYRHLKTRKRMLLLTREGIQELEQELLCLESSYREITKTVLHSVLESLNSRIHSRGLSAEEMIFQRDQPSVKTLAIKDEAGTGCVLCKESWSKCKIQGWPCQTHCCPSQF